MTITGIISFVMILVISLVTLVEWNFHSLAFSEFEIAIHEAVERTEERARTYVIALEGGRGLFRASNVVDRDEWNAYTTALNIESNYPGIQGLGYSIMVSAEEKETHEEQIQEEGFPDYKIHPVGERDPYSAIIYLEPFDVRNQEAFGYDMYSEGIRRAAMSTAIETGEPQLSGKITLVQEIDEDVQPGFLLYVPYYGNEEQPTNQVEREESIIGFIYAPFRARNFFEGIIGGAGIPGIAMEVYDGSIMDEEHLLYSDREEKLGDGTPRFTEIIPIKLAGRSWIFRFSSTETYGRQLNELYWVTGSMLLGIALGLLLVYAFYVNIMSEQRARMYADKQTGELKKAEEELKKQVADMERINKLMIHREKRIKELKKRVQE
jgi:CHASE1-domain containing sensor protein